MAAKRPGFARADTDFALDNISPADASSNNSSSGIPPTDTKTKEKTQVYETGLDEPPSPPGYDGELDRHEIGGPVDTAKDLVTQVIHVEDDPSINPWTFRMWFLGIGLSVFGSVLQEIFYFKPQVIYVSVVFLTVIAYVLGEFMAFVIPRKGWIGRWFNPGPFNLKEHAAIALMASASSQSALSTQALAAQQLFYGGYPSTGAGIFITLSSQLIGYGIAGCLRELLVFPTKMLWPMNLPVSSLLESLHRDKSETKHQLKIFYIIFGCIFVWEIFPEYIFTVLEGVSIFCLANKKSLVFTNLFGGAGGNEGLGFLSICFDWQYIASLGSPLWYPLYALTNTFIGYIGCIVLFMGIYYANIWRSQDFPFLSQLLFTNASNSTNFITYNQTMILNSAKEIDPELVRQHGLPWMTGTFVSSLITSNMGLTATFTHMLIWNYNDIKFAWSWASPANFRKLGKLDTWKFWTNPETMEERQAKKRNNPNLDPHYKLMLNYRDSPRWWFGSIFVASFIVGLVCLYIMDSTLPWWGFICACLLSLLFMVFFGAQYGLTGFQFNVQPICQMLGGYMFPGKPLANLYFTCYTFNALQQGQILARDLKLAQYVHLSPICTFVVQVLGCVVGALFNFIMMLTIVKAQAPILRSIEGSNIWSGQNIQQLNTLGIVWSMAHDLFSVGGRYQWVTLSFLLGFVVPLPFYFLHKAFPKQRVFTYLNMSIILWYLGWLFVGINASIGSYFVFGFGAQWYLRKYHPALFVKYNYLVSAALDGGTQVLVFIFTFAVFGGSGTAHPFPTWAGNPDTSKVNIDYCMLNTANFG